MPTETLSPGIAERTATVAPKGYEYDAFVSYCDADEEWTLSELIRPMQAAGVKVLHKEEFALGGNRIEEHANAVERSRRILIVMTPAWCESEWELQDGALAQTLNVGSVFPRLLPVILKPCAPPARLVQLVSLDFSDPSLRQAGFERLLRELGRSAQEINEAATKVVRKGIAALAELLRIPKVQSHVSSYQELIAEASELIGVLGRNKRLHDDFQRVEGAYKLLLHSKKGVAAGGDLWDDLDVAARAVARELELLIDFARTGDFPANDVLWTGKVERLIAELKTAVMDQDDDKLAGVCERLWNILNSQPTKINNKLVTTAGQLALGGMADKLNKICAEMTGATFDDEAQARLEDLRKGTESLLGLDRSLRILINNHKCLQEIDDSLRSFELMPRPDPAEIVENWIDLGDYFRALSADSGAAWMPGLLELSARMDAAVGRPPIEQKAVREFQGLFRDIRDKVNLVFNRADQDLHRFCEQLQKLGGTLTTAIGRMQNV